MTVDEAKKRLYGIGVDSYSRMGVCLELIDDMPAPDAYRVLAEAWVSCDNIATHKSRILEWIASASRADLDAMMRPAEVQQLREMPERFTVWRGCYEFNLHGLSWSLSREIATGFPALMRYRHDSQPLIVEGEAMRDAVVLLTERNESEIIASDVKIVSVRNL